MTDFAKGPGFGTYFGEFSLILLKIKVPYFWNIKINVTLPYYYCFYYNIILKINITVFYNNIIIKLYCYSNIIVFFLLLLPVLYSAYKCTRKRNSLLIYFTGVIVLFTEIFDFKVIRICFH